MFKGECSRVNVSIMVMLMFMLASATVGCDIRR